MRDRMHGVGNSRGSYAPHEMVDTCACIIRGEVRPRMVPGYAPLYET